MPAIAGIPGWADQSPKTPRVRLIAAAPVNPPGLTLAEPEPLPADNITLGPRLGELADPVTTVTATTLGREAHRLFQAYAEMTDVNIKKER